MPIPNFKELLDKAFAGEPAALAEWVEYTKKSAFSSAEKELIAARITALDILDDQNKNLYLNIYLVNVWKEYNSPFPEYEKLARAYELVVKNSENASAMTSLASIYANARVSQPPKDYAKEFRLKQEKQDEADFAEYLRERPAREFEKYKRERPALYGSDEAYIKDLKSKREVEERESFDKVAIVTRPGRARNEEFKKFKRERDFAEFKREGRAEEFEAFKVQFYSNKENEEELIRQFEYKIDEEERRNFSEAIDNKSFKKRGLETDTQAFERFKREKFKLSEEYVFMQQFDDKSKGNVVNANYTAFLRFKDEFAMQPFEEQQASHKNVKLQDFKKEQEPKDRELFKRESELKAFELYKRAAELKNPEAIFKLASMYLSGVGTEKNAEEAFKLFQEAAQLNHPDAPMQVAIMYEQGLGVAKDQVKANEFFNAASKDKVLAKLDNFVAFLNSNPKYQDLQKNSGFMVKARKICIESAVTVPKEEYLGKVSAEIESLAQKSFPHRTNILRAFADKVLKPLDYISKGKASALLEKYTGHKDFSSAPTERQKHLKRNLSELIGQQQPKQESTKEQDATKDGTLGPS